MQYSQFKPIEPTCLSQVQGNMPQVAMLSNTCCSKSSLENHVVQSNRLH